MHAFFTNFYQFERFPAMRHVPYSMRQKTKFSIKRLTSELRHITIKCATSRKSLLKSFRTVKSRLPQMLVRISDVTASIVIAFVTCCPNSHRSGMLEKERNKFTQPVAKAI